MKRTASAHWKGDIKNGKGEISTQSTTLKETQYSCKSRFEDGVGTNPEELLGASHAGCFTMAVSAALTKAGYPAGDLTTNATVDYDMKESKIAGITLNLNASLIEGLSADQFKLIATEAKETCPISKALASVSILLNVNYNS
ncbi:OsmC family peroxiredoxin [Pedobacter sp.]|jgi:osmotically inducible protein OsmC|uniref:OsmC family peroxiredoxin n=1 Tax=Pedobacter sp. TaxID=1411316 RepID=UPI002CC762D2|nr:OsmC family peroxiredoxin [Pedobacter sp.]HWW39200.1 OsmC family peroxiredoxin [Pedobacter sp.]